MEPRSWFSLVEPADAAPAAAVRSGVHVVGTRCDVEMDRMWWEVNY
jgi:hypothetical protein